MRKIFKIFGLFFTIGLASLVSNNSSNSDLSLIKNKESATSLVYSDVKIVDVCAGPSSSMALDDNGNAWVWGKNNLVPKRIKSCISKKIKNIAICGENNFYCLDYDTNVYSYYNYDYAGVLRGSSYSSLNSTGNKTEGYILSRETQYFGHTTYAALIDSNKIKINSSSSSGNSNYSYNEVIKNADCIGWASGHIGGVVLNSNTFKFIKSNYTDSAFFRFEEEINDMYDITNISINNDDSYSTTDPYTGVPSFFLTTTSGSVLSFGTNNSYNILGREDTINQLSSDQYKEIEGLKNIVKVSAGKNHCLALTNDGQVYSWGCNTSGQLGLGDYETRTRPTMIETFNNTYDIKIQASGSKENKYLIAKEGASDYQILTQSTKGNMTLNSLTGELTYTPNNGSSGYDVAVISMIIAGAKVNYQINININNAPYLTNGNTSFVIMSGDKLRSKIQVSDYDNDHLHFRVKQYPEKSILTLEEDTGYFEIVTLENIAGDDSFIIEISDGTDSIDIQYDYHIETKIKYNDNLEISLDNTSPATYSGNINVSDLDGDTITYSVISTPTKGTLNLDDSGKYEYQANEGAFGKDKFTIRLDDGVEAVDLTYIVNLYSFVENGTTLDHTISTGEILSDQIRILYKNCTPQYSIKKNPTKGHVIINQDGSYVYTPNAATSKEDSFIVKVSYEYGFIELPINVYQNSSPFTDSTEKNILVYENNTYSGSILANDIDGDILIYTVVNEPHLGIVNLNPSTGEYVYTPTNDIAGHDSFTVKVSDGMNEEIICINVKVESIPVVEETVNFVVNQNETLNDNLVANDKDGDTLTFRKIIDSSYGTSMIDEESGSFVYSPNTNYFGNDSFKVNVSDGLNNKEVTINIFVNRAPVVIKSEERLTTKNNAVSGSVNVNDLDGDSLTYSLYSFPNMGNVILNSFNGKFSYLPNETAKGNDEFFIKVADGYSYVLVKIIIHNETDLEFSEQESELYVNQGQSTRGRILAFDDDGDSLLYAIKTQPEKGTVTINQFEGYWEYTCLSSSTGLDSFVVTVTDGNISKDFEYTLRINIPPIVKATTNTQYNVYPNDIINGTIDVENNDGDTLHFDILESPKKGSVVINPFTGSYTYTVNDGVYGQDSFVVSISDGIFTEELTIKFNIKSCPVIENNIMFITINRGEYTRGHIVANDQDGDTLNYSIYQDCNKGNCSIDNKGNFTYYSASGAGDDSFIVKVSDGENDLFVTIMVHIETNIEVDYTSISLNCGENGTCEGAIVASDPDGDILHYVLKESPRYGKVELDGQNFTYKNTVNQTEQNDLFIINISDGNSSVDVIVNIIINKKPTVSDLNIICKQGKMASGVINAIDVDSENLEYTLDQEPIHGKVTLNSATGEFVYTTLSMTYFGNDTFAIKIFDGFNYTTCIVNVNITQNDLPVVEDISFNVIQGGSCTYQIIASDPNKEKLSYSLASGSKYSEINIDSVTGLITYRLTEKSFYGVDTFTVQVSDGINKVNVVARANVTRNQKPQISEAQLDVEQGKSGSLQLNVFDIENDDLEYTCTTETSYGYAEIDSRGVIKYTCKSNNYYGKDFVKVTVSDNCNTVSFNLLVNIIKNEKPEAKGLTFTVDSGQEYSGTIIASDKEGDTLTYSISTGPHKGTVTIDPETGYYSYIALDGSSGYDCFVVTINDGYNESSYLVEVNINFVDRSTEWALPATIVSSSVAVLSIVGVIVLIFVKKKVK